LMFIYCSYKSVVAKLMTLHRARNYLSLQNKKVKMLQCLSSTAWKHVGLEEVTIQIF